MKKSNEEQYFIKTIENNFKRLPDGKWQKVSGTMQFAFVCPEGVKPVHEWKKRYPTAYKAELDEFFDTIHPY